METGSVANKNKEGNTLLLIRMHKLQLGHVEQNSTSRDTKLATTSGIQLTENFKKVSFASLKVYRVQKHNEIDPCPRIKFCEEMVEKN